METIITEVCHTCSALEKIPQGRKAQECSWDDSQA